MGTLTGCGTFDGYNGFQNLPGTQAWFMFSFPSGICPAGYDIYVSMVDANGSTQDKFGVASTQGAVVPDTPAGTPITLPPSPGGVFYIEVTGLLSFSVSVSLGLVILGTNGGTFYIEVTGTGYFSVIVG